jgi:hypothetical protein
VLFPDETLQVYSLNRLSPVKVWLFPVVREAVIAAFDGSVQVTVKFVRPVTGSHEMVISPTCPESAFTHMVYFGSGGRGVAGLNPESPDSIKRSPMPPPPPGLHETDKDMMANRIAINIFFMELTAF